MFLALAEMSCSFLSPSFSWIRLCPGSLVSKSGGLGRLFSRSVLAAGAFVHSSKIFPPQKNLTVTSVHNFQPKLGQKKAGDFAEFCVQTVIK